MSSTLFPRRRRQTALVLFVLAIVSYFAYTRVPSLSTPTLDHSNHDQPPTLKIAPLPDSLPQEYGTTARPPFKGMILIADLPRQYLPKLDATAQTNDVEGERKQEPEGRRLIFIGDVHGMLAPLKELLQKIKFDGQSGDHVIFTGDLVSKGPDSVGVVEYAMELGASSVRGNHEDRVLLAAAQLALERKRKKHHKNKVAAVELKRRSEKESAIVAEVMTPIAEDEDDDEGLLSDTLEEEHFSHGDHKDRALAKTLTPHQLTWLASLPVILRVGTLPPLGELVTVHAGLVPGIPLKQQDPWAVMNMRTLVYPGNEVRVELARQAVEAARQALELDETKREQIRVGAEEAIVQAEAAKTVQEEDGDVAVPVAGRDGERWAKVWEQEMKRMVKGEKNKNKHGKKKHDKPSKGEEEKLTSVVYGHDSKKGLRIGTYTFGLDSGCVKGGQLSALVVEPAGNGQVKTTVVSVDCKSAGRAAEEAEDNDF